jgi:RNA methyltransferase, TrmH family
MSQKLLKKLTGRKHREETGLFLVEGKKSIEELLRSDFRIATIYATLSALEGFDASIDAYAKRMNVQKPEVICVSEETLASYGTFRTNNAGIAIAYQKHSVSEKEILDAAAHSFVLVLDDVRDPGNLGTIIRTADWFGVTHVVVSETTADFYNPKVIAASMGSFTRVTVTSRNLVDFLSKSTSHSLPILGAFLNGTDIFDLKKSAHGLLVMGSESHGIQKDIETFITQKITIPKYGNAESLNVAVATGIILGTLHT